VNAEVSADGHNWSMAAYATDYTQKTLQQNLSGRGRSYDYQERIAECALLGEDAAEPAEGYLGSGAEAGHQLLEFRRVRGGTGRRGRQAVRRLEALSRGAHRAGLPGFDMTSPTSAGPTSGWRP
jgi:hypothetical protein